MTVFVKIGNSFLNVAMISSVSDIPCLNIDDEEPYTKTKIIMSNGYKLEVAMDAYEVMQKIREALFGSHCDKTIGGQKE